MVLETLCVLACFKKSLLSFLHFLYRAVPVAAFSQVLSTGLHTHTVSISSIGTVASSAQERQGHSGVCAAKGREGAQGQAPSCLQGMAGSTVALQLRREGSGHLISGQISVWRAQRRQNLAAWCWNWSNWAQN